MNVKQEKEILNMFLSGLKAGKKKKGATRFRIICSLKPIFEF